MIWAINLLSYLGVGSGRQVNGKSYQSVPSRIQLIDLAAEAALDGAPALSGGHELLDAADPGQTCWSDLYWGQYA